MPISSTPKNIHESLRPAAWSWSVIAAAALFFWPGLAVEAVSAQTPAAAPVPAAEYRKDQILIQPKPRVTLATLAAFHAAQRGEVVRTFEGIGRLQVVRLPAGETVERALARYRKSGLVEFAEPDYLIHASAIPDDPKYLDGTLWGLDNLGQNGGVPDADIDAPEAWDVLNSASNIVVAVLDTGIRYTHEDLASNMWVNPIDGGHGFNAFTGTTDVWDDNFHGTFVAGVLGAAGNNGKGITGVAWRLQMMACKCLDSSAMGSDSTLIACIDYARTNGARIINASLDSTGVSLAVSNAIVAARDAGIIWVASCGNSVPPAPGVDVDVNPRYPACYPIDNIVAVAYTTRTDELGAQSNYGATNVDLAAPGENMYTTSIASDSSYYPPFSSINVAGTSFAAPYVSGAFALMLAKYPSENYRQIIARVLDAADPVPALSGKCVTGGRLNLKKALSPSLGLTAFSATNGLVRLVLSAGANRTCIIEASADLVGPWFPVFTNTTSTNGTFEVTEDPLAGGAGRFYRATASP